MVHTEAFAPLFGNAAIKEALTGFTERDAFPHALLLCGPEGSGKETVARLAARAIACRSARRPCLACEACRKIGADISPDVITVDLLEDRRTIGVEAVRQIRDTAYIKPNDLAVKIYLIFHAETMTEQAQNALLKLFEEPPTGVYFLLMASDASALLPTVRSRAPELRTELFDHRTMTALLREHSKKAQELADRDPTAFQRVLHAAAGSYGRALTLLGQAGKRTAKSFDAVEGVLKALAGSDKSELILALRREAGDRKGMVDLLRLLQTALRDMTAARRCDPVPELLFFATDAEAAKTAEAFTLPALIRLHDAVRDLAEEIATVNLNLITAAVTAAIQLWELK